MLKHLLDTNTISEPARPSPNRRLLAQVNGLIVVTANLAHFEAFDGLQSESWIG